MPCALSGHVCTAGEGVIVVWVGIPVLASVQRLQVTRVVKAYGTGFNGQQPAYIPRFPNGLVLGLLAMPSLLLLFILVRVKVAWVGLLLLGSQLHLQAMATLPQCSCTCSWGCNSQLKQTHSCYLSLSYHPKNSVVDVARWWHRLRSPTTNLAEPCGYIAHAAVPCCPCYHGYAIIFSALSR